MTLRAQGVIALVAILVVLRSATLLASDRPLAMSSYNWAVKASPNLAAKPPPNADIRKLIEQEDSDWGEDNDGTEICSFKFVDLGHDGNLTLLATRHDGGRGGCGDVHVVDRTAAGFEEHDLWGGPSGVDDVNTVLVDVDGKPYLSDYDYFATITQGGSQCFAGYTRIYSWDWSNYSNQSAQAQFKPFYEHEVESMKAREGENPECIKASIGRIQRTFLGAPTNTGLDEAIRLAKSNDPLWRGFAVGLLSNIGTAEAKDYLHALTTDSNKEVADYAKKTFAFTQFGQQRPQKHFLPIDDDGTLQPEPEPPPAGPWRLILPPMKGDKPDLAAADSQWQQRAGFDSQEQCEFGAESLRKENGSEPFLHGKCVAAATLAAH